MKAIRFTQQGLSLVLCAALLATSAPMADAVETTRAQLHPPSLQLPQIDLQPPATIGHVVDYFNANQEERIKEKGKGINDRETLNKKTPTFSPLSLNPSPLVILIQDLHANYGVQKNIAAILEFLKTKLQEKRIKDKGENNNSSVSPFSFIPSPSSIPFALAVEGAAGPVDTTVLAKLPNAQVQQAALDYLMREGEVTGAEYFAATNRQTSLLHGVEDAHSYQTHRDLFRKTYSQREELMEALKPLEAEITVARQKLYSPSLKILQKKMDAFQKGDLTAENYVWYIAQEAKKAGIAIPKNDSQLAVFLTGLEKAQVPEHLKKWTSTFLEQTVPYFSDAEKKTLAALAKQSSATDRYYQYLRDLIYAKQLFMVVPPELASYLEYLQLSNSGKLDTVLFQANQLAQQIKQQLAKTSSSPALSDLIAIEHDLSLLLRMIDFRASENEVRDFAPRLNRFIALAEALLRQGQGKKDKGENTGTPNQADPSSFTPSSISLRRTISSAVDFYAMALVRNKPLVENTLQLLGEPLTGNRQPGNRKQLLETAKRGPQNKKQKPDTANYLLKRKNISRLPVGGAPVSGASVVVLIAGGFHTRDVTEELRKRNVSFLVITPDVASLTQHDQDLYESRLRGIWLTPEEIFKGVPTAASRGQLALAPVTKEKAALSYLMERSGQAVAFLLTATIIQSILSHASLHDAWMSIESAYQALPTFAAVKAQLLADPAFVKQVATVAGTTITGAGAAATAYVLSGNPHESEMNKGINYKKPANAAEAIKAFLDAEEIRLANARFMAAEVQDHEQLIGIELERLDIRRNPYYADLPTSIYVLTDQKQLTPFTFFVHTVDKLEGKVLPYHIAPAVAQLTRFTQRHHFADERIRALTTYLTERGTAYLAFKASVVQPILLFEMRKNENETAAYDVLLDAIRQITQQSQNNDSVFYATDHLRGSLLVLGFSRWIGLSAWPILWVGYRLHYRLTGKDAARKAAVRLGRWGSRTQQVWLQEAVATKVEATFSLLLQPAQFVDWHGRRSEAVRDVMIKQATAMREEPLARFKQTLADALNEHLPTPMTMVGFGTADGIAVWSQSQVDPLSMLSSYGLAMAAAIRVFPKATRTLFSENIQSHRDYNRHRRWGASRAELLMFDTDVLEPAVAETTEFTATPNNSRATWARPSTQRADAAATFNTKRTHYAVSESATIVERQELFAEELQALQRVTQEDPLTILDKLESITNAVGENQPFLINGQRYSAKLFRQLAEGEQVHPTLIRDLMQDVFPQWKLLSVPPEIQKAVGLIVLYPQIAAEVNRLANRMHRKELFYGSAASDVVYPYAIYGYQTFLTNTRQTLDTSTTAIYKRLDREFLDILEAKKMGDGTLRTPIRPLAALVSRQLTLLVNAEALAQYAYDFSRESADSILLTGQMDQHGRIVSLTKPGETQIQQSTVFTVQLSIDPEDRHQRVFTNPVILRSSDSAAHARALRDAVSFNRTNRIFEEVSLRADLNGLLFDIQTFNAFSHGSEQLDREELRGIELRVVEQLNQVDNPWDFPDLDYEAVLKEVRQLQRAFEHLRLTTARTSDTHQTAPLNAQTFIAETQPPSSAGRATQVMRRSLSRSEIRVAINQVLAKSGIPSDVRPYLSAHLVRQVSEDNLLDPVHYAQSKIALYQNPTSPFRKEIDRQISERVGLAIRSLGHGKKKIVDSSGEIESTKLGLDFITLATPALNLPNQTSESLKNLSKALATMAGELAKLRNTASQASREGTLTADAALMHLANYHRWLTNYEETVTRFYDLADQLEPILSASTQDEAAGVLRFIRSTIRISKIALPKLRNRLDLAQAAETNDSFTVQELSEQIMSFYKNDAVALHITGRADAFIPGHLLTALIGISNLIDNGLDFGKRVVVNIDVDIVGVTLTVRDFGPGLPEGYDSPLLPEVGGQRQRFFALNNTSRSTEFGKGTGAGTSEAYYAVMDSDGKITVSNWKLASGKTGGAQIRIRLPLAPAAAPTSRLLSVTSQPTAELDDADNWVRSGWFMTARRQGYEVEKEVHRELAGVLPISYEERVRIAAKTVEENEALRAAGYPVPATRLHADDPTRVIQDLAPGITYDALVAKYGINHPKVIAARNAYMKMATDAIREFKDGGFLFDSGYQTNATYFDEDDGITVAGWIDATIPVDAATMDEIQWRVNGGNDAYKTRVLTPLADSSQQTVALVSSSDPTNFLTASSGRTNVLAASALYGWLKFFGMSEDRARRTGMASVHWLESNALIGIAIMTGIVSPLATLVIGVAFVFVGHMLPRLLLERGLEPADRTAVRVGLRSALVFGSYLLGSTATLSAIGHWLPLDQLSLTIIGIALLTAVRRWHIVYDEKQFNLRNKKRPNTWLRFADVVINHGSLVLSFALNAGVMAHAQSPSNVAPTWQRGTALLSSYAVVALIYVLRRFSSNNQATVRRFQLTEVDETVLDALGDARRRSPKGSVVRAMIDTIETHIQQTNDTNGLTVRTLQLKETFIQRSEPGEEALPFNQRKVYILVGGEVFLDRGPLTTPVVITQSTLIGEMGALTGYRTATARAQLAGTTVIEMTADAFLQVMRNNPDLASRLDQLIQERNSDNGADRNRGQSTSPLSDVNPKGLADRVAIAWRSLNHGGKVLGVTNVLNRGFIELAIGELKGADEETQQARRDLTLLINEIDAVNGLSENVSKTIREMTAHRSLSDAETAYYLNVLHELHAATLRIQALWRKASAHPAVQQTMPYKRMAIGDKIDLVIDRLNSRLEFVSGHSGQNDASVSELAEQLKKLFAEKLIRLRIDDALKKVSLPIHPLSLLSAVYNLVSNANDFTVEGKPIEVNMALTEQGLVSISVSNHGSFNDLSLLETAEGSDHQRVFDFNTTDRTESQRKGGRGTGLGTSEVLDVAHFLHGTALATHTNGVTTFSIIAPTEQKARTMSAALTHETTRQEGRAYYARHPQRAARALKWLKWMGQEQTIDRAIELFYAPRTFFEIKNLTFNPNFAEDHGGDAVQTQTRIKGVRSILRFSTLTSVLSVLASTTLFVLKMGPNVDGSLPVAILFGLSTLAVLALGFMAGNVFSHFLYNLRHPSAVLTLDGEPGRTTERNDARDTMRANLQTTDPIDYAQVLAAIAPFLEPGRRNLAEAMQVLHRLTSGQAQTYQEAAGQLAQERENRWAQAPAAPRPQESAKAFEQGLQARFRVNAVELNAIIRFMELYARLKKSLPGRDVEELYENYRKPSVKKYSLIEKTDILRDFIAAWKRSRWANAKVEEEFHSTFNSAMKKENRGFEQPLLQMLEGSILDDTLERILERSPEYDAYATQQTEAHPIVAALQNAIAAGPRDPDQLFIFQLLLDYILRTEDYDIFDPIELNAGFTLITKSNPDRPVLPNDRSAYLLVEGALRVERDGTAEEVEINAPALVGEVGLLRNGLRTRTVTLLRRSKLYRITSTAFGRVMSNVLPLREHLEKLAEARVAANAVQQPSSPDSRTWDSWKMYFQTKQGILVLSPAANDWADTDVLTPREAGQRMTQSAIAVIDRNAYAAVHPVELPALPNSFALISVTENERRLIRAIVALAAGDEKSARAALSNTEVLTPEAVDIFLRLRTNHRGHYRNLITQLTSVVGGPSSALYGTFLKLGVVSARVRLAEHEAVLVEYAKHAVQVETTPSGSLTLTHRDTYITGDKALRWLRAHYLGWLTPRDQSGPLYKDYGLNGLNESDIRWIQLVIAPWTRFEFESLRDEPEVFAGELDKPNERLDVSRLRQRWANRISTATYFGFYLGRAGAFLLPVLLAFETSVYAAATNHSVSPTHAVVSVLLTWALATALFFGDRLASGLTHLWFNYWYGFAALTNGQPAKWTRLMPLESTRLYYRDGTPILISFPIDGSVKAVRILSRADLKQLYPDAESLPDFPKYADHVLVYENKPEGIFRVSAVDYLHTWSLPVEFFRADYKWEHGRPPAVVIHQRGPHLFEVKSHMEPGNGMAVSKSGHELPENPWDHPKYESKPFSGSAAQLDPGTKYAHPSLEVLQDRQQQDVTILSEHDGTRMYGAADGMGGSSIVSQGTGTVASKIVRMVFLDALWAGEFNSTMSDGQVQEKYAELVERSKEKMREAGAEEWACQDMGATIALAVEMNGKAYILNLGDARGYEVTTDGKVILRTHDHSLVQDLYEAEMESLLPQGVTPKGKSRKDINIEAARSSARNVVIRSIQIRVPHPQQWSMNTDNIDESAFHVVPITEKTAGFLFMSDGPVDEFAYEGADRELEDAHEGTTILREIVVDLGDDTSKWSELPQKVIDRTKDIGNRLHSDAIDNLSVTVRWFDRSIEWNPVVETPVAPKSKWSLGRWAGGIFGKGSASALTHEITRREGRAYFGRHPWQAALAVKAAGLLKQDRTIDRAIELFYSPVKGFEISNLTFNPFFAKEHGGTAGQQLARARGVQWILGSSLVSGALSLSAGVALFAWKIAPNIEAHGVGHVGGFILYAAACLIIGALIGNIVAHFLYNLRHPGAVLTMEDSVTLPSRGQRGDGNEGWFCQVVLADGVYQKTVKPVIAGVYPISPVEQEQIRDTIVADNTVMREAGYSVPETRKHPTDPTRLEQDAAQGLTYSQILDRNDPQLAEQAWKNYRAKVDEIAAKLNLHFDYSPHGATYTETGEVVDLYDATIPISKERYEHVLDLWQKAQGATTASMRAHLLQAQQPPPPPLAPPPPQPKLLLAVKPGNEMRLAKELHVNQILAYAILRGKLTDGIEAFTFDEVQSLRGQNEAENRSGLLTSLLYATIAGIYKAAGYQLEADQMLNVTQAFWDELHTLEEYFLNRIASVEPESLEGVSFVQDRGGRTYQEDRIIAATSGATDIYGVADGAGGMGAGDLASQIVQRIWQESIEGGLFDDCANDNEVMEVAQGIIDECTSTLMEANVLPNASKMSTTLAVVIRIKDLGTYAVWVGDSRIYSLIPSETGLTAKLESVDQSVVQEMIVGGQISALEAATHPKRNTTMAISAHILGLPIVLKPGNGFIKLDSLPSGSVRLVTSDGLPDILAEESAKQDPPDLNAHTAERLLAEIADATLPMNTAAVANQLKDAALALGRKNSSSIDNITIGIAETTEEEWDGNAPLTANSSYASGKERIDRLKKHRLWKYFVPRKEGKRDSKGLTKHERRWIQLWHAPWIALEHMWLSTSPEYFLKTGHDEVDAKAADKRLKHANRIQVIINKLAPELAQLIALLACLEAIVYLTLRFEDASLLGVAAPLIGALLLYLSHYSLAGRAAGSAYHFFYNLFNGKAPLTASEPLDEVLANMLWKYLAPGWIRRNDGTVVRFDHALLLKVLEAGSRPGAPVTTEMQPLIDAIRELLDDVGFWMKFDRQHNTTQHEETLRLLATRQRNRDWDRKGMKAGETETLQYPAVGPLELTTVQANEFPEVRLQIYSWQDYRDVFNPKYAVDDIDYVLVDPSDPENMHVAYFKQGVPQVVGRSTRQNANDLTFDLPTAENISGRHVEITYQGDGRFTVQYLGRNGFFIPHQSSTGEDNDATRVLSAAPNDARVDDSPVTLIRLAPRNLPMARLLQFLNVKPESQQGTRILQGVKPRRQTPVRFEVRLIPLKTARMIIGRTELELEYDEKTLKVFGLTTTGERGAELASTQSNWRTPLTIGSGADNRIMIDDPRVSGKHLQIIFDRTREEWMLHDFSKNGTTSRETGVTYKGQTLPVNRLGGLTSQDLTLTQRFHIASNVQNRYGVYLDLVFNDHELTAYVVDGQGVRQPDPILLLRDGVKEITLGRRHLQINGSEIGAIDAQHLMIRFDTTTGGWMIRDLGALLGTTGPEGNGLQANTDYPLTSFTLTETKRRAFDAGVRVTQQMDDEGRVRYQLEQTGKNGGQGAPAWTELGMAESPNRLQQHEAYVAFTLWEAEPKATAPAKQQRNGWLGRFQLFDLSPILFVLGMAYFGLSEAWIAFLTTHPSVGQMVAEHRSLTQAALYGLIALVVVGGYALINGHLSRETAVKPVQTVIHRNQVAQAWSGKVGAVAQAADRENGSSAFDSGNIPPLTGTAANDLAAARSSLLTARSA